MHNYVLVQKKIWDTNSVQGQTNYQISYIEYSPLCKSFKPQLPIGYSWQKQDGGTHSSIHKFVHKNRAQSDLTFFPGQG